VGHIASSDFSKRHEAILEEGRRRRPASDPRVLEKLKREGRLNKNDRPDGSRGAGFALEARDNLINAIGLTASRSVMPKA
jgi:hypothetical protein